MSKFIPQFATGYAFSANDLFTRFKLHYIKNNPFEAFREPSKKKVAARVFIYAFYLIIKDIIDNGVTFMLPVSREAYFEMSTVSGDEFIEARKRGAYQDVDFLASNFTGHKIQYRYKLKSGKYIKKPFCVHKKLKNIITENTNNGKRY